MECLAVSVRHLSLLLLVIAVKHLPYVARLIRLNLLILKYRRIRGENDRGLQNTHKQI